MAETVQLITTVTDCGMCPKRESKRYYTADSFENVQEWMCGAKRNKRITLHEWNDPKPAIPAWCPLRPNV